MKISKYDTNDLFDEIICSIFMRSMGIMIRVMMGFYGWNLWGEYMLYYYTVTE
jgi:hypothetical protein